MSSAESSRDMRDLTSSELIALLDDRSEKIGSAAWCELVPRAEYKLVVDAIVLGKIKTIKGLTRASNCLLNHGRAATGASAAYEHMLTHPSVHVLDNALFGLVFLRDSSKLPLLRRELDRGAARSEECRAYLVLAIRALEADDPSIYSPHFRDASGVWTIQPDSSAGG